MSGKLYHIRIRPSAMLGVHLSAVIPAQVILAAVHKISGYRLAPSLSLTSTLW